MKIAKQLLPHLCLALFSLIVTGQHPLSFNTTARSTALGGCSSGFTGIEASFGNQAGIAELEKPSFLASALQRFGIGELSQYAVAAAFKTGKTSSVYTSLFQYGDKSYAEQGFGLGYAFSADASFQCAAQLVLLRFHSSEYESVVHPNFQLSLRARVIEEVWIHAHAFNPIGLQLKEDYRVPGYLTLGLSYSPHERVLVISELQKEISTPPVFRLGVEYFPSDQLILRFGSSSGGNILGMGIGQKILTNYRIDLGFSYHQYLGITPALTILTLQI